MRWVTKECANGRLFKSICLMSLIYGCLFVPSLQAEPVKLAVLLPFSGVYRESGLAAKNGFLLGLKKEASEAKINLESWVTFDFLDSRADADHSLELAKKVIGEGAKAILGIVSSEVAVQLKDYVLDEAQADIEQVPLPSFWNRYCCASLTNASRKQFDTLDRPSRQTSEAF